MVDKDDMTELETIDEIPWDDEGEAPILTVTPRTANSEIAKTRAEDRSAKTPSKKTVTEQAPSGKTATEKAPSEKTATEKVPIVDAEVIAEASGPILPTVPMTAAADLADKTASVDDEFFESDDEPFERPGAQKLGIVGGKGVGKSYLFQSMVYRTCAGTQSGALTYYLESDAVRLFTALRRKDRASTVNLVRFVKNYARWHRLPQTTLLEQKWYRLRLPYRTGLLGRRRSYLDVEFFDGSGEGFFEAVRDADNRQLWVEGYLNARVMVFCLPLWVAFPDFGLPPSDWQTRDEVLESFEQVIQNFADLRTLHQRTHPVCSILALTMADDRRSGLKTLRDRWISPYIDSSPTYLRRLRRGSGVARYIANARKVSEILHEEFSHCRDPLVAAIPQKLNFHGGKPWLIPMSAIEGSLLEGIEIKYRTEDRPRLPPPVPVHVELPLLVALCDRSNALM